MITLSKLSPEQREKLRAYCQFVLPGRQFEKAKNALEREIRRR